MRLDHVLTKNNACCKKLCYILMKRFECMKTIIIMIELHTLTSHLMSS